MRVLPAGDRALLVDFGQRAGAGASALALAAELDREPLPGQRDLVPATTSLMVHYEPLGSAPPEGHASSFALLRAAIEERLRGRVRAAETAGREVEIPVRYGGEAGEDLEAVAQACGLEPAQFVALHSAAVYHVDMLGFLPGFAYLGGLDERLRMPRRRVPRARVPAGSVAIGGPYTAVYPLASPGGWHLIGRTEVSLFDVQADPPALLQPGDRVHFRVLAP